MRYCETAQAEQKAAITADSEMKNK